MTPETPSDPPKANLSNISDGKLVDAYQKFQKDEKTKDNDQVKKDISHELSSLKQELISKDQIEEEIVRRSLEKKGEKSFRDQFLALFEKGKEKVTQKGVDDFLLQYINSKIPGLDLTKQDLQTLRDNLPIIDGVDGKGKLVALGQEGQAHAVQFDDFVIEEKKNKEGKNEGYAFVYKVYVDVPDGSEKLKQMVRSSDLNLGSAQVGGHKFDVVVKGDPAPDYQRDKDKGNLPVVKEVNKDSAEYEQGKAGEKKDYKGVCLTDEKGRKTIYVRQDLPDGEKQSVLKHEISHLCGMVSEGKILDEKTHQQRPITLEDAQKDQEALLSATKANGVDDTKGKRKEYFDLGIRALTADDVMKSFDDTDTIAEYKQGIVDGANEKNIYVSETKISELIGGIKLYAAQVLPEYANNKNLQAINFFTDKSINKNRSVEAQSCLDQVKTSIKNHLQPVLEDFHMIMENQKYESLRGLYQTNGKYDLDKCQSLSNTFQGIVQSPDTIKTYFLVEQYQGKVDSIKTELTASLDKSISTPEEKAKVKQSVDKTDFSKVQKFEDLDPFIQAEASKVNLGVFGKTPVTGEAEKLAETAKSNIKEAIKTQLATKDIPQDKLQVIADKYFDYLVAQKKIIISESVPGADAYRTKFEDGILTVEFGKKEDWEKEGKAPETPGTKQEGILGQFQVMFGEAKHAFEQAIQDKKSVFAALGAAFSAFFAGLLKFLGDKFGLKLTPDESADKDVADSKAAFEKLGTGLTIPSDDWFKKDALTLVSKPSDGNWEKAWKDFYSGDVENYSKFSKGKGNTDAGAILMEAKAFKDQTGEKKAMDVFYNERHKENAEKDKGEKIKDGVKQTWADMKKEYSDVELDDSVITALDIKEPLETNGQPDKVKYRSEIEKAFDACLGKREMIKKWCVYLKKHNAPLNIEWWKSCETNKSYMSLPAIFNVQNVNFDSIESSYMKNKTAGFDLNQFTADFNALNWEQKGKLLQTNEWPAPATK